jgi:hypothetical protein
MGTAAKKPCSAVMCPVLLSNGERYCEKHAARVREQTNEGRRSDEVRRWYKTVRWLNFQRWFIRHHPICQRVIDGKRCQQIATVVHHLLSPRDRPDLFTNEENCRALCVTHHHGGQGAGPDEVYAVDGW